MRPNQKRSKKTLSLSIRSLTRPLGTSQEGAHVGKVRAFWLVSVVACLLAIAGEPAAAQPGPGGLKPCIYCKQGCFDDGVGTRCTPAPKGVNKGGTHCEGRYSWMENPVDEDRGWWHCICIASGELCALRQTFAPIDQDALGREATEVVASGGVLPADGFFFVGFRAGEPVVRWKCDGSIAGRVTQAGQPAKRRSLGA